MSKTSAVTNPAAAKADRVSEATASKSRAVLTMGSCYAGTIVHSYTAHGLYDVHIDNFGVLQCKWAAGIFSGLLGFRTNYSPPPSTKVVVLYGAPSFIINMIPSDPPDFDHGGDRSLTGMQEPSMFDYDAFAKLRTSQTGRAQTPGCDAIEGDIEVTNYMGVGLQLLKGLAKLSGGGRAEIETHVLNDMVRIISEVFKHHSSFGDFQIYNNGRLNCRVDGTSYDHEAWGAQTPDGEKAPFNGNKVLLDEMNTVEATGRWRFSQYVGFLGNFLHVFFTDPTEVLGKFAEDNIRSGKAAIHVNADGTILAQSVSEIVLERVVRIPVPIEIKRPDDPSVSRETMDELNKDFLKLWNYGEDFKDAWKTTYQLREYARWLSQYHAVSRFLQLEEQGVWKMPTEAETPEPDINCKEPDKEEANKGILPYYDVYSTIRLMRDGSTVVMGGRGCSTTMVNGCLSLTAPRHITMEAGGDFNIIAGQSVHIKARNSIEIAAVRGGLVLKSRAWFRALCEWGSIWIKSDAVDPEDPDSEIPTPEDEDNDPAPEVLSQAIFLDATRGKTMLRSERTLSLEVHGDPDNPEDLEDKTGSVVIQSKSQSFIGKAKNILLAADQKDGLFITAAKSFFTRGSKFTMDLKEMFSVGRKFTYWIYRKEGDDTISEELHLKTLKSNTVLGKNSIKGPNRQPEATGDTSNYFPHLNHIDKIRDSDNADIEFPTDEEKEGTEEARAMRPFATELTDKGLAWKFGEKEDYLWGNDEEIRDDNHLIQSITQQGLEEADSHAEWIWDSDTVQAAPRNDRRATPFPGQGATMWVHETEAAELDTPSEEKPTADGSPLRPIKAAFKFLKKE